MKVAKAQFTGKNWKTNEDTWGDLDTWERRDHELIRGYLNDSPVRFGECELKAGMNKSSEMMAFGWSRKNENSSWNAPDGWKEFSQSKTIMRGWQQASTMNLEENRARLKRNSSSVFKWWEWQRETPPRIIEAHRKNQKRRGWANYEKNLKDLGEKHLTNDNSFLRQTWRRIWE